MAELPLFGERELAFPAALRSARIEFFDLVVSVQGLDGFLVGYERSHEIKVGTTKVRVLPRDRIIASKRAVNRPKDRAPSRNSGPNRRQDRPSASEEHSHQESPAWPRSRISEAEFRDPVLASGREMSGGAMKCQNVDVFLERVTV